MSGVLTLRLVNQAQMDARRVTTQLADLQRQISSGYKYDDLQGYGSGSSRLLNAQSLKAAAESRMSVIDQLQARFGVQAAALGRVAEASRLLSQSIREAISANDGRGIATELDLTFSSVVSALNESWNGQPMFAGERQGSGPVKINSLDELLASTSPEDVFDEAARHQTINLVGGEPIKMAAKASELSQGLFESLKSLKLLLDGAGGSIGQPISNIQRDALIAFASQLDQHAESFVNEEARSGQLQKRFETERSRTQAQSDLLTKEIGDQADANLAEVSVKLNTLMVQYEATAKTFAELSKLSLLNYL